MKNIKFLVKCVIMAVSLSVAAHADSKPNLKINPVSLMMGLRVNQNTIKPGGTITLMNFYVANTGTQDAGEFSICIYLSTDDQINDSDKRLWEEIIPSMAAGNRQSIQAGAITLPSDIEPGNYFLAVMADCYNSVYEDNETDNYLLSRNNLQILSPIDVDLVFSMSNGTIVGAGKGGLRALLDSPSGPLSIAPHGDLSFSYKVVNNGSEKTPEFQVSYWISKDRPNSFDDLKLGDDWRLGITTFNELAGGQDVFSGEFSYSIPHEIGPGEYFIVAIIDKDDIVFETHGANAEANNVYIRPLTVLNTTPDDTPVWRVQLCLKTADVRKARTDDPVFAHLGYQKDVTYIAYAREDFERNDEYTYDLLLDTVATYADIWNLVIGLEGGNGWCLSKFSLIVNGSILFRKEYSGDGLWLNGSNTQLRIPYCELRSTSLWSQVTNPLNFTDRGTMGFSLTHEDIASITQAVVGNAIHGKNVYWGNYHGDPVEVTRESDNSVKVDLDMALATSLLWDPDLDIDFIIYINCSCDGIEITTSTPHVDVGPKWFQPIFDWIVDLIEDDGYKKQISEFSKGFTQNLPIDSPTCPIISVSPSADIVFDVVTPIKDIALSIDLPSKVRLGSSLPITYSVQNIGNVDPGDYSISTVLTDPEREVNLDLDTITGPAVSPCRNPVASLIRQVNLPNGLQCNTFSSLFGPDIEHLDNPNYTITATIINPNDHVVSNNVTTARLNLGLPDVSVQALELESNRVLAGYSVTMNATIANLGIFKTEALLATVKGKRRSDTEFRRTLLNRTLPILDPGVTKNLSFFIPIPTDIPAGTYELSFQVKLENDGEECSTNNNERRVLLTVLPSI